MPGQQLGRHHQENLITMNCHISRGWLLVAWFVVVCAVVCAVGKEVELKVYVRNEDRTSKTMLSKDEFKKEAALATKHGKERLLELNTFPENRVHVVSVFKGLQCIIMPVFTPLEKQN